MKLNRVFVVSIALLLLPLTVQGQEDKKERKGEGEEKPGVLERLGDEIQEKGDKEDDSEAVHASFWAFFDPVQLVEALASRKPGPYPYNNDGGTLLRSERYPGGIVQLQTAYFQHSADVWGFLWRYRYFDQRFNFESELDLLQEDLGNRVDRQGWVSGRLGWDFVSLPQFQAGGQLGLRALLEERDTVGPEIGLRFVALPGRPLVLEGQSTMSLLSGELLSTHTFSLGVMLWRFEVLVGGHVFRVNDTVLDGWQFGVRAWL